MKSVAILVLVTFAVSACAVKPTSESDKSVYYEASFNDHNHAPAAMTPPATAGTDSQPLDPVYVRTQADFHFAAGDSLSLEGQHEKAIEEFKTTLVYDPNSVSVLLRIAVEYVKVGMVSEGLQYAQRAEKQDAKSIEAKILLAGLYSSLKMYDKAASEYEAVLKIDPKNSEAPLYLGAVAAELGQYDRSVKLFQSLLDNPEYSTPHLAMYYIGRVRQDQKQFKQAETAYNKALQFKPDFADAALALSGLFSKSGKEDKARQVLAKFQQSQGPSLKVAETLAQLYLESEDYDAAFAQLEIIEAGGDDPLNAKVKMALILIEKKIYDRAVAKLEEILKIVPDSDKIRFYLGAVHEELKHYDLAVTEFKRVPATSSFYGESTLHAAYLLKVQKKNDDAVKLLQGGIAARPDVPQMYSLYASILDEGGKYPEAQKMLEGALKQFPENVQLHFFLGNIFDRQGNKPETIKEMQKVIELDPNHTQGLNYLAFTYAELGQHLEDAESMARRAAQFEPQDGFILDTLGWILYKRGKTDESIRFLEKAIKLQPEESVIAEHLGDAYYRNKMVEAALKMYVLAQQIAQQVDKDDKKIETIKNKISSIRKQEVVAPPRQPASASNAASAE